MNNFRSGTVDGVDVTRNRVTDFVVVLNTEFFNCPFVGRQGFFCHRFDFLGIAVTESGSDHVAGEEFGRVFDT